MTKLSRKPINDQKLGHYINNLWSAFTLMDSKEDIRLLFRSLFTHTEYKMFAKRLEIARRLIQNDTYESMVKDLKVSEKTISHISNILAEKGEGFLKADARLVELDKKYERRLKERQDRLERRTRKKLPGEVFLPELLGATALAIDTKLTKTLRRRSAARDLQL